ncbi:GNAT family N-acetyltransferase [Agrobacterium tumefaciens]|uniref:GNAT family N-acetyltransferase n=1 Tax=Agrobacterium tumefaciens TaxID=358 RepID=UPI001574C67A|nr:GNAT family N-acetyltransferase [Agrobacterium tumefaciens]NSZ66056.1 GNAT family N-acetyltransferase [Agrobacterium tumefaciens]NTA72427.1 GNAT family N-acetyltransferase [Agrobacterium tumefaciens]WIE41166.1 GNAT family N-acetyltransferase [Agrobacterium tumefaciens]
MGPARAGEEAELAEVGLASWRKGIKPHVDDAVAARIEDQNPFIRQLGPQILVAEYQGKAAGIGASEHGDNQISDIWVAPEFEGRGAGWLLIRALERQIADRGFAEAFIHVTAANGRALGLYRHLGYRDVWQRSEFDPILEATLEKIRLKKIF